MKNSQTFHCSLPSAAPSLPLFVQLFLSGANGIETYIDFHRHWLNLSRWNLLLLPPSLLLSGAPCACICNGMENGIIHEWAVSKRSTPFNRNECIFYEFTAKRTSNRLLQLQRMHFGILVAAFLTFAPMFIAPVTFYIGSMVDSIDVIRWTHTRTQTQCIGMYVEHNGNGQFGDCSIQQCPDIKQITFRLSVGRSFACNRHYFQCTLCEWARRYLTHTHSCASSFIVFQ